MFLYAKSIVESMRSTEGRASPIPGVTVAMTIVITLVADTTRSISTPRLNFFAVKRAASANAERGSFEAPGPDATSFEERGS